MNLLAQYFYALLFTGIIHLSLAVFVLIQGIKNRVNQTYALYSISIAIWAIFEALGITSYNKALALFFWRFNHMGVIFIPVGFVHFVYSTLNIRGEKRKLIPVSYCVAFFFVTLNCTKLLILEVVPKFQFRYFINPGLMYHIFFTFWVAWAIYGLVELFRGYFKSSGAKRKQLRYFCWSMLIAYIGGVPNFFPTFNIEIPILMPFATYAIPTYAFFTVYAIVRHQLMDIEVVIKKTLVFAGLFIAAYAVFALFALRGQGMLEQLISGMHKDTRIDNRLIYLSVSGAINAITSTLIGLFVFLRNRKNIVNKTFAIFALYVAMWSYAYIFWPLARDQSECLFWFRMIHIGAILVPAGFYHFVLSFLGKERKGSVILAYSMSAFFLAFSFTRYYVIDVRPILYFPYFGVPGILYHCFLMMFIGYAGISIYLLLKEYRLSQDTKRKNQCLCIAIGLIIGFLAGGTNYLLWYNILVPPYLNIFVSVYVVTVAYAIVRYQLMNIEIIIKKTLIFAGLFVVAYAIFTFFAMFGQLFLEKLVASNRWVAMVPSVLVIIFMLRPLENLLVNITDKYLFQKKYDYKELLRTFTSEVLTVLDIKKLPGLTIEKLADIVKLKSCAMLLMSPTAEEFILSSSQGLKEDNITLVKPNNLITFLENTNSYILKSQEGPSSKIPDMIRADMTRLNAELIIPLVLHEKLIGLLALGKKKSDEDFSQDDIDIILPLSRTLAIAISNAELFEELSKTQAEAAQKEKMALVGTLAAGMAHEIRNPITTIKVFTEFLKEKKDDPHFIETFERLVPKEVEKINHMITHLLEFSKPADYRTMEKVDLRDQLKDVLGILENEMVLNDIVLEEETADIPLIWGNEKYIQEVLFNLIQNAIHAIGRRGNISIRAEDHGDSVGLTIADTGCGISPEHLPRLFEPFFTTKLDSKGVGLGLYVIRQLMIRMEGAITVKSAVGQGTTFTLRFKRANL